MDSDLLSYAIDHGILDVAYLQQQVNMEKRKELLEKHSHKIWQGKDGRWYTYIVEEGVRRLKKRSTKKEVEDVVVAHVRERLENPTLKELFDEWNNRRLDMKKISASSHMRYKRIFERHYGEIETTRIRDLEPRKLIDFLEEQIPKYNLSAKAFSNLKTITKGMVKRAKRRDLIKWNVEEAFYELDVSESEFKRQFKEEYQDVYTDYEREKVIAYLYDHLDNILNVGILLLFATGMRVGELMALKPCDIEDANTIRVRRTETCYLGEKGEYIRDVKNFTKTEAGIRTIIVPDIFSRVVIMAKNANPQGEYVFEKNGRRLTVRACEARLINVCKTLDIPCKSPHKIRKTYGSILLDNHVDARMIMDQMGHTDLTTTERFYHRNRKMNDGKRVILNSLPEFQMV